MTASVEYTIKKADLAAGDFTFTSPTDLTYNGSAKTATVTTAKTGVGTVTVAYFKGENQVAEPKEAGDYCLTTILSKTGKAGSPSVFNSFRKVQRNRMFSPKTISR